MASATTSAAAATPREENGVSKKGSGWSRVHRKINDAADGFFYSLGYWVATHAKRTLLISFVLVIACMFGFANFKEENDGEDLWVPSDSSSKKQEEIVLEFFPDSGGFAVFLAESPSEDGNILTKESIDTLWELNDLVYSIEVSGRTYADICTTELNTETCNQPPRGVTRFWGNDFSIYQDSVTNDADILSAINVENYPDGQEINYEAVFGNSVTYDASGDITGARAFVQMYDISSGSDDLDADWEGAFQDEMEKESDSVTIFNFNYYTGRSIDDALEESTSGEIFLFVITYTIMIIFVMVALGRCRAGPVLRRSWIGVGGVGLVLAAALAAYGLNSAFGVPFTALSSILPFILVGIGVDDMFVIVSAFDHTDPSLPLEERIALGLKRCGVSVTYTSLTNFLAFMLGSLTSLPAVEYFCLYAGTAILFDFFLQMTAFVAFLTMDANRQKAGKFDWCCCCKSSKHLEEQERVQRGVDLTSTAENGGAKPTEEKRINGVGRFMRDKYTPFILSAKGKVLVLVATASLLVAGIYGVTQATQGFEVLDLAPDDHYARDYTELARVYELEIETQYIPVNVYTREVDYPDVAVQTQIQATDALMQEQQFVTGPLESWLASFIEWAANGTEYSANVGTSGGFPVYDDRATFYPALTAFTADGDNSRFTADIAYNNAGEIEISRTELFLIDLTDVDNNVDALEDVRDVVDQSALEPKPFGFSAVFIFTEQYLVIYDELIVNFILALVAVAIMSVFVLGRFAIVALVCITVVMIDIELLGFVYHWGLDVNSITVIQLIMAVGLVVDYMVHIVHYFLHQDPSVDKDTRIAKALGEIGPSVIVGATTTFLGIMPLVFASNVIFRVFFKMFLIIITFGFFHGVVFVPVALSLLPECAVTASEQTPSESNAYRGNGKGATVAGQSTAVSG